MILFSVYKFLRYSFLWFSLPFFSSLFLSFSFLFIIYPYIAQRFFAVWKITVTCSLSKSMEVDQRLLLTTTPAASCLDGPRGALGDLSSSCLSINPSFV